MASTRETVRRLKQAYKRHGSLRHPGFWVVSLYHFGRWSSDLPPIPRKLTGGVYGALLTSMEVVMGTTVNREAEIGEALHLVHADSVRIGPGAILGDRVGIMHGVTIGTTPEDRGVPIIGNDVFIGAGAKVLGNIRIGDGAMIAANSVVVSDVPAGATAIGVPARALRYRGKAGTSSPPEAPKEGETGEAPVSAVVESTRA